MSDALIGLGVFADTVAVQTIAPAPVKIPLASALNVALQVIAASPLYVVGPGLDIAAVDSA